MLRAAVQAPTFAVEIDWAETARAACRRFVKAALVFVGRLVVLMVSASQRFGHPTQWPQNAMIGLCGHSLLPPTIGQMTGDTRALEPIPRLTKAGRPEEDDE